MGECERAQQRSAYHDDELPAPAKAEFEEHILQCHNCSAELAELRELSKLLDGLPEQEIPSRVLDRLHRSANDASQAGILRVVRVMSAAAILLICSAWMWRLSTSGAEPGQHQYRQWERVALRQDEMTVDETSEDPLAMWMIERLTGNGDRD